MIGFIVLACHISFSSAKLNCEWVVKKSFDTLAACEVYDQAYELRKGEQMSTCDELNDGVKEGDRRPALVIKK